jgi:hypothetical protein
MVTRHRALRRALQVAVVVVPVLGPVVSFGQAAVRDTSPLRVLFVGNSYTYVNDLPRILQTLAVEAREPRLPEVQAITPGGQTLAGHWAGGKAVDAIRKGGWDYVVLQEQSTRPIKAPDSMLVYGRRFIDEVKRAGARPLLFLTWARDSQPETQGALTAAYQRLAVETGAEVVPVGTAWQHVRAERPGLRLFLADGSHPSPLGSYLAAAVFYGVLYGRTPAHPAPYAFTTTFAPTFEVERVAPVRLSDADVAALWATAQQVLRDRPAAALPRPR